MPRYEFVEGTSSKFWEITLAGTSFTTTWGKIGTAGQSTEKSWKDAATAQKEYDKLVAEKVKKGYTLVGGGDAAEAAPAPAAKAAPKAKAEPKAKAAPAPAPAPAPAAPAASGATRYELVEGTSSKFWEIKLDGAKFTTTYGKIGTAGQTTLKEFKDAAAAQKEHDKLVAEKTKKGYSLASGGGGAAPAAGGAVHAKAGTAFRMADLEQLDGRPFGDDGDDEDGKGPTFMGMKIAVFDPEEGIKDPARKAWKLMSEDFGSTQSFIDEVLKPFLADPNAGKVKALVIGNWGEGVNDGGKSAEQLRDALCAAKGTLTSLAALFVNDVHADECEISWQHFTDVAPILAAFPELQHLRVRGDTGGGAKLQHARLRSLQFEGSNLGSEVLRQLAQSDLPALEHLEVWLGPEDYNGGNKDMADLMPILSGKLFPALKYLGLRDSDQADEVARTVAQAPLLERLDTLDLSLGNMGDEGAEALIASPAVAKLKKLDVRHHYLTDPVLKRLKALKPVKVAESASEEDVDEDEEGARRYVAVAE